MRNETPRTFVGTTTFTVSGLTEGGEVAIVAEIGAIEGVASVGVDPVSGAVAVTASRPVDRADIARAVEAAGYILTG